MPHLAARLLPPAVLLAACCLAAPARADETNPAVVACDGKRDGDPCSAKRPRQDASGNATLVDEPGTCQPDECCTLDYSSGSPPKSTCGPCLACKPGAPVPTSGGNESAGGSTEPPRTDEGGPPPHEPKKKGCSIADEPIVAWAALPFALLWLRRRS